MMYWIILIGLAVLILVTIAVTVVTIVKERKEYRKYKLEEERGTEDDDYGDDYEDDRVPKKSKKSGAQQTYSGRRDRQSSDRKRRWKIILEDTDTGEQYTYIFYDNLGIGRTTKEVAFEEFLSIPDDRRISKVHCAIVRSDDKLYLRDEGSKNHTYLNGKKIQKPIIIQKEDFISLGETEFEVIKILRETY
ncbi:FHA domain-containing protein [Clostridium sp. C105KSO13]|uniref:FHA domain-containing protein n=1 Tax=Clostridium sp. C105KSO13 TaxID=1776045 RepID=UPI0007407D9E|nr:FHA domain-containing protein [Clostridium sp. C105KSO13]CUX37300.1 FHA domain protein [Clostridium sp. C105KSO13]